MKKNYFRTLRTFIIFQKNKKHMCCISNIYIYKYIYYIHIYYQLTDLLILKSNHAFYKYGIKVSRCLSCKRCLLQSPVTWITPKTHTVERGTASCKFPLTSTYVPCHVCSPKQIHTQSKYKYITIKHACMYTLYTIKLAYVHMFYMHICFIFICYLKYISISDIWKFQKPNKNNLINKIDTVSHG